MWAASPCLRAASAHGVRWLREPLLAVEHVEEEPELAMRYKVNTIPMLMVVKDGQVVAQSLGAKPKQQILDMIP